MFTGIIKEIGIVKELRDNHSGKLIKISCSKLIDEMNIDDSVAVNGVCQTVIDIDRPRSFLVETVKTTLNKTTLGDLRVGEEVNLELALRPTDRMGGHIVLGHVNGVAPIVAITKIQGNTIFKFRPPAQLQKYLVAEGSVCVDGISLTIANIDSSSGPEAIYEDVSLSIISHSLKNTTLKNKKVGDRINIEVDILSKYLEKLVFKQSNSSLTTSSSISLEWLKEKGF